MDPRVGSFFEFLQQLHSSSSEHPARDELISFDIKNQYKAISKYVKDHGKYKNKSQQAHHKLLKYVAVCATKDPVRGDYTDEESRKLVKDAGNLLAENDNMHSILIWSSIPERYHRDIDIMWNGIGGWMG